MNKFARVFVVLAVIALFAAPASFAADQKNTFRFQVGYFMPSGDFSFTEDLTDFDDDGTNDVLNGKIEYDTAIGAGIDYERRLTPLIGLDFGFKYFNPDIKLSATLDLTGDGGSSDSFEIKEGGKFQPLTAGVMFHVLGGKGLDLYLGPELAYIMYGDVTFTDPSGLATLSASFDDEFTYGAKAGLDVPLGENWAVGATLEYIMADSKVKDTGDMEVKLDPTPFIFMASVGYKF